MYNVLVVCARRHRILQLHLVGLPPSGKKHFHVDKISMKCSASDRIQDFFRILAVLPHGMKRQTSLTVSLGPRLHTSHQDFPFSSTYQRIKKFSNQLRNDFHPIFTLFRSFTCTPKQELSRSASNFTMKRCALKWSIFRISLVVCTKRRGSRQYQPLRALRSFEKRTKS